jgi:nitroreductase
VSFRWPPVERELLEECFDLAFQTPTGGNQQAWHFIVVTDADQKKALAEMYRKSQSENTIRREIRVLR